MSNALGNHHGKPIMGASVKITNAGDGLTKPLAAEPRLFPPGTRLPVLVWCRVGNEDYDPIEIEGGDDEADVIGYRLKFNFKAREAYVLDRVDPLILDNLVDGQREAVRLYDLEQKRLKDEAKGVASLDGLEPGGAVDGGAPVRPEGLSDEEWEASLAPSQWQEAASQAEVASLGARRDQAVAGGGKGRRRGK